MRAALATLLLTGALGGCAGEVDHHGPSGCTSHYEGVFTAPTRAELRTRLLAEPRVVAWHPVGHARHRQVVNLLDRRDRVVRQVEVAGVGQAGAGDRWTAGSWAQCID
ncbi:MAG: hypothetical protein ACXVW4_15070 [Nocardioides sp.]